MQRKLTNWIGKSWPTNRVSKSSQILECTIALAEWKKTLFFHIKFVIQKLNLGFWESFTICKVKIRARIEEEGTLIERLELWRNWIWRYIFLHNYSFTSKNTGQNLLFNVSDKLAFEVPLTNVMRCVGTKSEAILEFNDNMGETPVQLSEMRFHIPQDPENEDQDAAEAHS